MSSLSLFLLDIQDFPSVNQKLWHLSMQLKWLWNKHIFFNWLAVANILKLLWRRQGQGQTLDWYNAHFISFHEQKQKHCCLNVVNVCSCRIGAAIMGVKLWSLGFHKYIQAWLSYKVSNLNWMVIRFNNDFFIVICCMEGKNWCSWP